MIPCPALFLLRRRCLAAASAFCGEQGGMYSGNRGTAEDALLTEVMDAFYRRSKHACPLCAAQSLLMRTPCLLCALCRTPIPLGYTRHTSRFLMLWCAALCCAVPGHCSCVCCGPF